MSAPAIPPSDHASAPARSPWLFGPLPDLLFGCGALYLLILCALSIAGPAVRLTQPTVVFPLLILVLSAPHYGATILRVYEHRRDRRAYAVFALWATLFVLAWFVLGVYEHTAGSLLLTLFLTWSPWHYTGQNYGIAVMFLRRAGVPLDPGTKRLVYASFLLNFLLTVVVLHTSTGHFDYSVAAAPADGNAIRFLPLGIPGAVTDVLASALGAGWIAATLLASVRLGRLAPLRSLAPTALLAVTHALWFGIPVALLQWDRKPIESLDFDYRTYYFLWIALAHALQYLWVTTYYARAGANWTGTGRYYLKTLLAGKALFVLPVVLLAPLGALSHDGGLALLVASAVNVHHFILDGAIWKLRDSRIARVLILRCDDDATARNDALPRGVWGVAAACLAAGLFVFWTDLVTLPQRMRTGDHAGAARALDQLARLGFDHERTRAQLASNLLDAGRVDAAAAQAKRSLELRDSAEGWRLLGDAQFRRRRWAEALASYERGLAFEADSLHLLVRVAQAHAALGHEESAREALRRASAASGTDDAQAREVIAGLEAQLAKGRQN
jgi:tetratricopeptide (TPR) repeat protein